MLAAEMTDQELDVIYMQEIIADPRLTKKQKAFLQFHYFQYPKIYKRTKRGLLKATSMYFGWNILDAHDLILKTLIDQKFYKSLVDAAQKRIEDQHLKGGKDIEKIS